MALSVSLPGQRPDRGPDRGKVWEHLAKTYDKDKNGKITLEEYGRGERPFKNLDRDGDDAITSADFERRRGGRRRGGQRRGGEGRGTPGAMRARRIGDLLGSFINTDGEAGISKKDWDVLLKTLEPDAEGNIPKENFRKLTGLSGDGRFARMMGNRVPQLFDVDRDGAVSVGDLEKLFAMMDADGDGLVALGSEIDMPPGRGEMAPDFTLPFADDAKKTVTLSSYRGKKPVALIFGSYT